MVKRVLVAVLAAVASLAVVAVPVSAAPSGFRFTVAGPTADAALSNCGPNPAPGTECTVLLVFAAEQRLRENGVKTRDEFLSVDLLDLRITGPGTFEVVSSRFGFTTDANVTIGGSLRSGSASADDVELSDGSVVDIDVSWNGFGDLSRSRFRETFTDGGTTFRFSSNSRFRQAVARATVDGATFTESDPLEVPSGLSRSRFTEVCRGDCDFGPF